MSAALLDEFQEPHAVTLDAPVAVIQASTDPAERVSTGYAGSSRTRRALREWIPLPGGPNTDTLPDLPTLRARSRDAARNIPLATGALATQVTTTVGTGLQAHPRIDRVLLGLSDDAARAWQDRAERLWCAFSGSDACDLSRRLSFAAMQDVALRSALESGDVLLVRRYQRRPGEIFGLKLQLIEADRVCNPNNVMDRDQLMGGVELDADGAPVQFHVLNRHPGEFLSFGMNRFTWTTIPAVGPISGEPMARLVARLSRPGQVRGVPILAPVLEMLKQLGRYTDAELMAAVVSAFFTVFVKTDLPDSVLPENDTSVTSLALPVPDTKLGHGSIVDLLPGESIETANPARPNDKMDPFILAILRQIGVALELPFEFLVKHFTSSYSASQAALLEAWRAVVTRRGWFAGEFCQQAYEWFLAEAIQRGLLEAPGFFEDALMRYAWSQVDWRGPARGQINQLQETEAARLRVVEGFSTRQRETAELTGGDWDENQEQNVREHELRAKAGLEPDILGVQANNKVAPAPGTAADQDETAPLNAGGQ